MRQRNRLFDRPATHLESGDADTAPAGELDGAAPSCPIWFDGLAVLAVSGILSFGGFGLLLADAGHYKAAPALGLGAAGTAIGTFLARPRRTERAGRQAGQARPALTMCAVAVIQLVWNGIYAIHHVNTGEDPGVYVITGKWLARHGNLIVPAAAQWPGHSPLVTYPTNGLYPGPHGTLQFQFAHLLSVLIAEVDSIGGDGLMFRTPAILGAVALLVIYAAGCRIVRRPWLVVAAVTGLAVSLPELNVTRDTFSEPSTQILLWGGILLLIRANVTRSSAVALMAGLAIGGTLMSHIDSVVYLVPLPILAALRWLTVREGADRRAFGRVIGFAAVGVVPPALLGTWDVQHRAGFYYDDLGHQMHRLYELLGASVLVAVVVVAVAARAPALWERTLSPLRRNHGRIATGFAWLAALGLFAGWVLRPLRPTAHGALSSIVVPMQQAAGLPIQPGRTYSEQTLVWIQWYIGPVALALAIVGVAILVMRALRAGSAPALIMLMLVGGVAVLYLWNPNAVPIQVWATRRYVAGPLPMFMLAAALVVDVAITFVVRHVPNSPWPGRVGAGAVAGLVVFPLAATWPVRSFENMANLYAALTKACQVIGPNAAIVMTPDMPHFSNNESLLGMSYRDWCNVPVATLVAPEPVSALAPLAAELKAEGRQLWVLGQTTNLVNQAVPGVTAQFISSAVAPRSLPITLVSPPNFYQSASWGIYGAPVP